MPCCCHFRCLKLVHTSVHLHPDYHRLLSLSFTDGCATCPHQVHCLQLFTHFTSLEGFKDQTKSRKSHWYSKQDSQGYEWKQHQCNEEPLAKVCLSELLLLHVIHPCLTAEDQHNPQAWVSSVIQCLSVSKMFCSLTPIWKYSAAESL